MMVILTRIDLKLYATMQGTDDEWILQNSGGYAACFHLVETNELDQSTGERVWKITRWDWNSLQVTFLEVYSGVDECQQIAR